MNLFRFCTVSICSGSVQYQWYRYSSDLSYYCWSSYWESNYEACCQVGFYLFSYILHFHVMSQLLCIVISMVVETQLWNLLTVSKSPHVLFDPIGFDLIFLFLKHNFNRIYTFKNCSSRGFVRSSSRCRLQSLRWQWRWKTIKQVRKLFKITLRPKKKTCI